MTHVSDELLSAMLDGPAAALGKEPPVPASDAAHVDGCAQCQERLGVLRGVATAVASRTPPPAAHLREAAVAAALIESTGATATLRRLVSSNRRRSTSERAPARRMSSLSAAAALFVALAVGGFAISQTGTDTGDGSGGFNSATREQRTDSATADLSTGAETFAGDDAGDTDAGTDESATDAETLGAGETSAMHAAGYDAGAIGSYSNIDDVAARASQDMEKSPEEKAAHPYVDRPPCPVPDGQGLEWHASLSFDGVPAYARVLSITASSRVLEVLAQTDCAELATREIAPTTPR
jgi:hypothetical protein